MITLAIEDRWTKSMRCIGMLTVWADAIEAMSEAAIRFRKAGQLAVATLLDSQVATLVQEATRHLDTLALGNGHDAELLAGDKDSGPDYPPLSGSNGHALEAGASNAEKCTPADRGCAEAQASPAPVRKTALQIEAEIQQAFIDCALVSDPQGREVGDKFLCEARTLLRAGKVELAERKLGAALTAMDGGK